MAASSNVRAAMQVFKKHKESRKHDANKGVKQSSCGRQMKEMEMYKMPDK